MTFTPGPWWIDDDGFVSSGGGDEYVTVADFDCDNTMDIMEREANKVLGATAPDLYGCLKSVVEQAVLLGMFDRKGPESLPFRDAQKVLQVLEGTLAELG